MSGLHSKFARVSEVSLPDPWQPSGNSHNSKCSSSKSGSLPKRGEIITLLFGSGIRRVHVITERTVRAHCSLSGEPCLTPISSSLEAPTQSFANPCVKPGHAGTPTHQGKPPTKQAPTTTAPGTLACEPHTQRISPHSNNRATSTFQSRDIRAQDTYCSSPICCSWRCY